MLGLSDSPVFVSNNCASCRCLNAVLLSPATGPSLPSRWVSAAPHREATLRNPRVPRDISNVSAQLGRGGRRRGSLSHNPTRSGHRPHKRESTTLSLGPRAAFCSVSTSSGGIPRAYVSDPRPRVIIHARALASHWAHPNGQFVTWRPPPPRAAGFPLFKGHTRRLVTRKRWRPQTTMEKGRVEADSGVGETTCVATVVKQSLDRVGAETCSWLRWTGMRQSDFTEPVKRSTCSCRANVSAYLVCNAYCMCNKTVSTCSSCVVLSSLGLRWWSSFF